MPLPIPFGGISTSSQVLPGPTIHHIEDTDDDNLCRQPQKKHRFQSIAFTTCPAKEWQARVVTSFYDVVVVENNQNNDKLPDNTTSREKQTMVEIRIQISPLSCPLSTKYYRETLSHLKWMDGAPHNECPHSKQQPHLVFSQDRRYLAVLLFHPYQNSSTVVIFQLRRPRFHRDNSSSNNTTNAVSSSLSLHRKSTIPIPSYISNPSSSDYNSGTRNYHNNYSHSLVVESTPVSPAVATNPKFVSIWGITAICSMPSIPSTAAISTTKTAAAAATAATKIRNTTATRIGSADTLSRSILLAMCQDGTMVWVDLKSAQAIATGRLPFSSLEHQDQSSSVSASEKSPTVGSSVIPNSSTSIFPITNMQVSPTSTLESGTVALVTSSASFVTRNGSIASRRAECILASWSIESTTPRHQTLLKRASTGTVSTTNPTSRSNSWDGVTNNNTTNLPRKSGRGLFPKQSVNGRDRPAPQRTVSDTLQTLLKNPNTTTSSRTTTNTANNNTLSNKKRFIFRTKSTGKNGTELVEKLNHMNLPYLRNIVRSDSKRTLGEVELEKIALQQRKLFVLQELQKRQAQLERSYYDDWDLPTESQHSNIAPKRSQSGSGMTGLLGNTVLSISPRSLGENVPVTTRSHRMVHRQYPRRKSDPDKAGEDKTKQKVKIEILSTWSGSAGNSEGDHRHLHSKKIVVGVCFGALSSVLCVLYRSASTQRERRQRVAQVLTISESGILSPVASLFLSLEQLEQATNLGRKSDTSDGHIRSDTLHCPQESSLVMDIPAYSCFSLDYDCGLDTFIVNSVFGGGQCWLGCLWSWRDDALGWLIRHDSLPHLSWSRLHICQDKKGGSCLVHLDSIHDEDGANNAIEITKRIVSMATLSPSSNGTARLFERSTLMLSSTSMGIPLARRKASNSFLHELEWKISSLPASYISLYGPPRLAAIGPTNSKSVAVASACGLCVWDTASRHEWKQFGTPSEEKSFTVLGMVWWEGRASKKRKSLEDDDIIIAIIRLNTGQQYLAGWSPKK
jgi:hypothetical protein